MLYRLTKLKKLTATEFRCWWESLQIPHTQSKMIARISFSKQDKFTWEFELCHTINVNIKCLFETITSYHFPVGHISDFKGIFYKKNICSFASQDTVSCFKDSFTGKQDRNTLEKQFLQCTECINNFLVWAVYTKPQQKKKDDGNVTRMPFLAALYRDFASFLYCSGNKLRSLFSSHSINHMKATVKLNKIVRCLDFALKLVVIIPHMLNE